MSLDYNLTAIKDRSVHFPPNEESPNLLGTLNLKVYSAIWACISTQIGTITEENADEWFFRYVLWNRLSGLNDGEYTLTRQDVHHLVGLSTNVFPDLNRQEWSARLIDRMIDDLDYRTRDWNATTDREEGSQED